MKKITSDLEFEQLRDFDKKNDILFVRFSIDRLSNDYMIPQNLKMFVDLLRKDEYNVLVFPKECDIEVENEEIIETFIETVKKRLKKI